MQAEIKIVDMNSLDLLKRLQENLHTLTGLAFDFVDIGGSKPKKMKPNMKSNCAD